MRFDDRLKTALMQPIENEARAKTQWSQLIDLLSQDPHEIESNLIIDGLHKLRMLMDLVDENHKIQSLHSIMGRLQSPPLLQLLVGDTASVALNAIRAAQFNDEQWSSLIPLLPSRTRGFLRNRDDLGTKSKETLARWASADFILPSRDISEIDSSIDNQILQLDDNLTEKNSLIINDDIEELDETLILGSNDIVKDAVDLKSTELEDNIGISMDSEELSDIDSHETLPDNRQRIDEIVRKIENLRSKREHYDAPQLPLEGGFEADNRYVSEIYFSTDNDGTINWVDGVPRGALVGTSISEASYDNAPGTDAAGASSFKQRIAFENVRMKLCGADMIAGDWRINAVPFFDTVSGRFKGYKGLLRRPNIVESAGVIQEQSDVYNTTFEGETSDNLQQLIHELRTPLGAVIGFAEIIEQQLFGPASAEYRTLAKTILEEGNRLLSGFDDLNIAAKIDSGNFQASLGLTNVDWLSHKVSDALKPLLENENIKLEILGADALRPLMIENSDAERLLVRLLSALITASQRDEILIGRWGMLSGKRPMNQFTISMPSELRSMSEQQLLESGPEHREENDRAPLLGLGFSLRLVRNLANNLGGSLLFHKDIVILSLPASREKPIEKAENNLD